MVRDKGRRTPCQWLCVFLCRLTSDIQPILVCPSDMNGIDLDGGMHARTTLALMVFCCLASVSYLLELYQSVFRHPDTFKWLPAFVTLFEDVPQILLSLVLSGALSDYEVDPTPLAAFNIATSLYRAMIKVTTQVFVNFCYCCTFTEADADEEDRSS